MRAKRLINDGALRLSHPNTSCSFPEMLPGPKGAVCFSGACVATEWGGLFEPFLVSLRPRREAVNGKPSGEVLPQAGLPECPPLWKAGDWEASFLAQLSGLLTAGAHTQITMAATNKNTYF